MEKASKKLLEKVCHTSERTWSGTVHTLSDIRYPELEGRKILCELINGQLKYTWV